MLRFVSTGPTATITISKHSAEHRSGREQPASMAGCRSGHWFLALTLSKHCASSSLKSVPGIGQSIYGSASLRSTSPFGVRNRSRSRPLCRARRLRCKGTLFRRTSPIHAGVARHSHRDSRSINEQIRRPTNGFMTAWQNAAFCQAHEPCSVGLSDASPCQARRTPRERMEQIVFIVQSLGGGFGLPLAFPLLFADAFRGVGFHVCADGPGLPLCGQLLRLVRLRRGEIVQLGTVGPHIV